MKHPFDFQKQTYKERKGVLIQKNITKFTKKIMITFKG